MSQVIEFMKNHRSIRQFEKKDIKEEVLLEVLEAAQWASTSSNFQAYSVIVIRNDEMKQKLSKLSGNQKHIVDAPIFLVFVADLSKINLALQKEGVTPKFNNVESYTVSIIDAALVGQNVMLAAESLGLGGVFIGGIRNESEEVHKLLKLPDYTFPVFGMCLGYPNKDNIPEQKPRLPMQTYVHSETYHQENMSEYIEQYDQVMERYYQERTDSNRNDTWSKYVSRYHQQKSREHLRAYLEKQGFGFH